MATNINKYGYPLVKYPVPDEAWHWFEQFYLIDAKTAGTKYMCFNDTPKRVIWRETVADNVTTLEFAWGAWNNRASLTYYPINGTCPVADADI